MAKNLGLAGRTGAAERTKMDQVPLVLLVAEVRRTELGSEEDQVPFS